MGDGLRLMSVPVLDPVVLSGWARCSARRFPLGALVTLLLVLVQAGCSRTQPASARGDAANPIAVRSFPVEEEVVRRRVQAVGSLYALEESTISAEGDGRVERALADVGATIKEGQVLVTLSGPELQYELDRQRATVRQGRARLGLGPNEPLPAAPAQGAFGARPAPGPVD